MSSLPQQVILVSHHNQKNSAFLRPIFLFFGLLVLIISYDLTPTDNLLLRSWLTTISGLFLIWSYIFLRYNGLIPLRTDVLMVYGFSLSHLLPIFYLSARISAEPDLDLWEIAHTYPLVALVTTTGALALCIGYELIERRLSNKSPIQLANEFMPIVKAKLLIILIASIVWIVRGILLYKGAYYWVFVNEEYVFGPWYSITSRISIYGLIVPIYLWLLQYKNRRLRPWAWFATILEFAWLIPTGSRGVILTTLSALIIVYWWNNRRLPWRWIIAISLVIIITMPVIGEYRYTISNFTDVNRVGIGSTISAYSLAMDHFGSFDMTRILDDKTVFRLFDGQYLGFLLENYRKFFDWEYGSTYYTRLPFLLLPYFIYQDRPGMQVHLNIWFNLFVRGGAPSTFLGEAYVNFGFLGVPAIAFLIGMILAIYDVEFRKRQNNYFVIAIYLLFINQMPSFVSQSLALWLATLRDAVLMVLLFYIVKSLLLLNVKRTQRSMSLNPPAL